jgi:hypothetical protein
VSRGGGVCHPGGFQPKSKIRQNDWYVGQHCPIALVPDATLCRRTDTHTHTHNGGLACRAGLSGWSAHTLCFYTPDHSQGSPRRAQHIYMYLTVRASHQRRDLTLARDFVRKRLVLRAVLQQRPAYMSLFYRTIFEPRPSTICLTHIRPHRSWSQSSQVTPRVWPWVHSDSPHSLARGRAKASFCFNAATRRRPTSVSNNQPPH